MSTSTIRTRRREGGFTLIEVVIALAIVAVTAVVLLDRRVGIVQDAIHSREIRTLWVLATQKMAELELDKTLWTGEGGQSGGDFSDLDPAFGDYAYEYLIERRDVPTNDPAKLEEKPKEIFRLTFQVRGPVLPEPMVLQAEFPVDPPKTTFGGEGAPAGTSETPPPAPGQPFQAPPPVPGGPK